MAFNPTIPLPKQGEPKLKKGKEMFIRSDFKQDYSKLLRDVKTTRTSSKSNLQFDFLSELNKHWIGNE